MHALGDGRWDGKRGDGAGRASGGGGRGARGGRTHPLGARISRRGRRAAVPRAKARSASRSIWPQRNRAGRGAAAARAGAERGHLRLRRLRRRRRDQHRALGLGAAQAGRRGRLLRPAAPHRRLWPEHAGHGEAGRARHAPRGQRRLRRHRRRRGGRRRAARHGGGGHRSPHRLAAPAESRRHPQSAPAGLHLPRARAGRGGRRLPPAARPAQAAAGSGLVLERTAPRAEPARTARPGRARHHRRRGAAHRTQSHSGALRPQRVGQGRAPGRAGAQVGGAARGRNHRRRRRLQARAAHQRRGPPRRRLGGRAAAPHRRPARGARAGRTARPRQRRTAGVASAHRYRGHRHGGAPGDARAAAKPGRLVDRLARGRGRHRRGETGGEVPPSGAGPRRRGRRRQGLGPQRRRFPPLRRALALLTAPDPLRRPQARGRRHAGHLEHRCLLGGAGERGPRQAGPCPAQPAAAHRRGAEPGGDRHASRRAAAEARALRRRKSRAGLRLFGADRARGPVAPRQEGHRAGSSEVAAR